MNETPRQDGSDKRYESPVQVDAKEKLKETPKSKEVMSEEEEKMQHQLEEDKIISKNEEEIALERMEILGIKTIDELIGDAEVSQEQKDSWRALAKLDIPKEAKIKIVAVMGDPDFDKCRELPLILEAMKVHHPNVTLAFIDNNLPKVEKMKMLAHEFNSPSDEIIIPYFSSHGDTKSSYEEKGIAVNSPEDTFTVVSGYRKKAMDIRDAKDNEDATEMVRIYTSELIDPATHEIKPIVPGTIFRLGDREVTCKGYEQEIRQRYKYVEDEIPLDPRKLLISEAEVNKAKPRQLIPYTPEEKQKISEDDLRSLFDSLLSKNSHKKIVEEDINMMDLATLQNAAIGKNQEFIYIFENCFSGSATNDAIASADGTKAILASSSESEPSWHNHALKSGVFMHHLFSMVKDGSSLGEAFIRTDLFLHTKRIELEKKGVWHQPIQNPKAAIRDGKSMIEVTSIQNQEDRTPPLGEEEIA